MSSAGKQQPVKSDGHENMPFDAHMSMSTQALNSPRIREEMKDILLGLTCAALWGIAGKRQRIKK